MMTLRSSAFEPGQERAQAYGKKIDNVSLPYRWSGAPRETRSFSLILVDRDARDYRSLQEPLEWQNSTLLSGDAADSVAKLKGELDTDLVILGSGELIRALMPHRLIDRFVLLIHPLVLGKGRRLFDDDGPLAAFKVTNTTTTTTGVVIATYELTDQPARS